MSAVASVRKSANGRDGDSVGELIGEGVADAERAIRAELGGEVQALREKVDAQARTIERLESRIAELEGARRRWPGVGRGGR